MAKSGPDGLPGVPAGLRRLAVLGGSFDPIHEGHLAVARALLCAGWEHVVLVPAARSPFKVGQEPASAHDRWAMLALAIQDEPRFSIWAHELERPGPSYSVDTVAELHRRLPDAELGWVVGSDHVHSLPDWRAIDRLAALCRLVVAPREPIVTDRLRSALAALPLALQARIDCLDMAVMPVASTRIRSEGGPGLPPAVQAWVDHYGLYGATHPELAAPAPEALDLAPIAERLVAFLETRMPPHRRAHILGVAATAEALAGQFGADPAKARVAGLAHDLARLWPGERLLEACRQRGLEVSPFDRANPMPRLHGLIAARLVQEEFGVADGDIQAAIASHTLGRPGMSLLERIVFVADYIEPGRGDHANPVRAALAQGLDQAVLLAMEQTIAHLVDTHLPIHPQALDARNWQLARIPRPDLYLQPASGKLEA